jgi:hypothetical protein
MREGLKKLKFDPPILLSESEFAIITENNKLCDDDGLSLP